MPVITFTEEDLQKQPVLPQGWYPFVVEEVKDGPGSKDPQSTTTTIRLKYAGADPEGKLGNVRLRYWIPEKYPRMGKRYLRAIAGQDLVKGQAYDPAAGTGMTVSCFVVTELYKNELQNKIQDFRPMSEHV